MRIFLSYASDDRSSAEAIAVRLQLENHDVFFDRQDLQSGHGYDQKIRQEVESCDLFVFIISPDSIAKGRYTLTELKFAMEKWQNLGGHVLPVMARPTEINAVPAALSALGILVAEGNLPAEVVARIARDSQRRKRRIVIAASVVAAILAMLIGYSLYDPQVEPDLEQVNLSSGKTSESGVVTDECEGQSELAHCDLELARKICADQREAAALLDSGSETGDSNAAEIAPAIHFYGTVNSPSDADAAQLRTLLDNVKNWMAREDFDLLPSASDERVFIDQKVVLENEYASGGHLLVVSSQLNPPYEEGGVRIRGGDSSIYFSARHSVSVLFTLPENRFAKPYDLHRAAIAYSRAQLTTSTARKLELLNDAREAINRACKGS